MPMLRRDPMRRHGLRPPRMRVRRVTSFSINRMIPNVLTLLALCAGMTAIRYATMEKYEAAAIALIIAGILDGLDGRMARLLKANSSFGAQLDSLSDFLSFGVAPAIVLYFWSISQLGPLGWVIALFFAACCALRLARFNTQLDVELPPYAYNFFTGVPAPAAAGLVLVPMFFAFEWGDAVARAPWLNAISMAAVAVLMVSRVPTISLKRIRIQHHQVVPALLVVGVLAAFATTAPWPLLTAVGLLYLFSIPFSVARFYKLKRTYEAPQPSAAAAAPGAEIAPGVPAQSTPGEAPGAFTRH
jgi:CDP-diacylglycerol--serine O-phosphatidyltransferase